MSNAPGAHAPYLMHAGLLASHYRRLASCASHPEVAKELALIAQSFENEAVALFGHPCDAEG